MSEITLFLVVIQSFNCVQDRFIGPPDKPRFPILSFCSSAVENHTLRYFSTRSARSKRNHLSACDAQAGLSASGRGNYIHRLER